MQGSGFVYSPKGDFHGHDAFSLVVVGVINGRPGRSTIQITVSDDSNQFKVPDDFGQFTVSENSGRETSAIKKGTILAHHGPGSIGTAVSLVTPKGSRFSP
jgi:hypothetical protein